VDQIEQARPTSARIALARLAGAVIALDGGVEPTLGLGRWVTVDERRPISGVVASEEAGGKVGIELHLVVQWPPQPLEGLAEKLRWELRREAARAGLGDRLGEIAIDFQDLALPDLGETPG
jgi:hypothetical protein